MHDNIITQNIKLIDTKMIINEVKFEISDDTKYLLYYVTREFEPKICERCGFNNFAIYRARILYISSDGNVPFKKSNNKRGLYQKNKKKKGG